METCYVLCGRFVACSRQSLTRWGPGTGTTTRNEEMSVSPHVVAKGAGCGASFAAAPCSLAGKHPWASAHTTAQVLQTHGAAGPEPQVLAGRAHPARHMPLPQAASAKQPLTFSLPQGPQDGPALALPGRPPLYKCLLFLPVLPSEVVAQARLS